MSTPIEKIRKVETYAVLVAKYSKHAQSSGEGSMREHFMEEAKKAFVLLSEDLK